MNRNYPAEIEADAIYLAQVAAERDAAKQHLEEIEDQISAEVIARKNDNGKPYYSNETLRGIHIRERCRQSGTYKNWEKQLEAKEAARVLVGAKLERLRNEFSVWKIEERRRIAEMEAVSG